jgi:hypothetical protein
MQADCGHFEKVIVHEYFGLDSNGSGWGLVTDLYEQGNK